MQFFLRLTVYWLLQVLSATEFVDLKTFLQILFEKGFEPTASDQSKI